MPEFKTYKGILPVLFLMCAGLVAQSRVLNTDYPAAHDLVTVANGGLLSQVAEGTVPKEVIYLKAGDDIQAAIDSLHSVKGGAIVLGAGNYNVSRALIIYSEIAICGDSSLNPWDVIITPNTTYYNEPIIFSDAPIHNVHFENFKVQGRLTDAEQHLDATYHSEGKAKADTSIHNSLMGILLTAEGSTYETAESFNITMNNLEVSNCAMGIHIKGARDVKLSNMNVHHNGMIEAYYHNLYFRRVFNFTIEDSEFHHSPTGNGMNVSQSEDVSLINNLCHDNFFRGLRVEGESGYIINKITIVGNTCKANGLTNGQPGIRLRNITTGTVASNVSTGNGSNTNFAGNGNITFTNNSWQ